MGNVLAVDQGTTGTTVLVVRDDGTTAGRGYLEHPQHFPRPGWVEHDAMAIWASVIDATGQALDDAGIRAADIDAVGITNQRETVVAWDARTGTPLGPTIVWQDRRTADLCAQLHAEGHDRPIRAISGLPVDPYFSGTKVAWLLQHDDTVRAAATEGTLRIGTIDSWLVWQMTGGRMHLTDASNAARTMLYDIHRGCWAPELCELFGVDSAWLPTVVDSCGPLADCDPTAFVGVSAPIAGIAGDQQSALFGQCCFEPGQAKATYGTGAFVLVNSGADVPVTDALIATVAWQRSGERSFALEGSIFTAGASVQWLRDGLETIPTAPDVEALAASVPDSGGVVLVPAFAGIGAPIWDAHARASILGITRGTTRAHIARATLEAIALRVRQAVGAMRDEGTPVTELRVDGGMASNNLFLQLQADVLGVAVTRPTCVETTSLGAAYLALLGAGIVSGTDELTELWQAERIFTPADDVAWVESAVARFDQAVQLTRAFGS